MSTIRKFTSAAVLQDSALGDRQIRVVASDATPDRVNDVMVPGGCKLDNYRKNPIVLADHDPSKPIGRAHVEIKNGRVEALIDFAPPGISPKADEYCGLAKAGMLNAVSVGFNPIAHEPTKDGGYFYKEWELMELSLVSVPANPQALVIGRSVKSDGTWKCGASRNLPLDDKASWDGPAAEKRIFDKAGFDGDSPDTAWARKAFLAYDASAPKLKGSYKLPFADVVDGRLVAVESGIRAAASRLPQADIPDDVQEKARAVLDHYEARFKDEDGKGATVPRTKTIKPKIKGLYEVAQLAYILDQLGWAQSVAEWEAACEEDGSKVPAMLAVAMHQVADALIAMTVEEIQELLADRDVEIPADLATDDSLTLATKQIRAVFRKAKLNQANSTHLDEAAKCLDKAYALADKLRDMEHHIMTAGEHVKAVRDANKPSEEDGDDGEQPDIELGFEAARRKRMTAILGLAAAP